MRAFRVEFNCPHCGKTCESTLDINVNPATPPNTPIEDWKETLHPNDLAVVEIAERSGILDSYGMAVKLADPSQQAPRNLPKRFLHDLSRAKPIDIRSHPAIRMMIDQQFPKGKVEVWGFAQVAGIIVDDALRLFVPRNYLTEPKLAANAHSIKVKDLTGGMNKLEQWIRTKNGYVPPTAQMFLAEVRKKSPGHFAKLGNL